MKQRLKVLHTSDIHLDDRIGSDDDLSHGQQGLMSVVNAAIEAQVDLFLLAGDLFDHNRVKAPCLDFATEQLARLTCPVVMITGNHDCLADYSVYHRYDPRDAGAHVTFIDNEDGAFHRFDELGVTLWGRGIVEHGPENQPLYHVPEHEHEGWFIGMAHGYYTGRDAQMYSSLITPDEIHESGLDYLALGHVHVFATMRHGRTLAAYPGSPNPGQGAREMTAALVDLDPESGVIARKLDLLPGSS